MSKAGVQWGWKVTCMEPGCKQSREGWSYEGVPGLPYSGVHADGVLKGWLVCFATGGALWYYRKGHLAYCPQHGEEARAYFESYHAWEARRYKFAQGEAKGLLDRIVEWLGLDKTIEERNQAMRSQMVGRMEKWIKDNPRPMPPWREVR